MNVKFGNAYVDGMKQDFSYSIVLRFGCNTYQDLKHWSNVLIWIGHLVSDIGLTHVNNLHAAAFAAFRKVPFEKSIKNK